MSISVVMPQLGLTMEEGTLTGWLKKTGDPVKKDEPLFTLSTDKAEMEVESVVDGILGKIVVQAGEVVPVGTILAYIEGISENVPATSNKQPAVEAVPPNTPKPEVARPPRAVNAPTDTVTQERVTRSASPRAKRLAKELNVDLDSVNTGIRTGTISEKDIHRVATSTRPSSTPSSTHRQLIAERLTRSVQTIPTFSLSVEVNAEKLLISYESLKEKILKASGVKLTVTDLLLKVFALALKTSPALNAIWSENSVRNLTPVDIGLAVDTPKGVIVPILRNADTLDIPSLVIQRLELADKARGGQLSLTQLEGGVATLSNLGMYRIDRFQAIISPGQSSILAVGQIRKRPWVADTLVIKPTVMLNLSVDHRVADGAAAAVFLDKIVEMIENLDRAIWANA